MSGYHDDQRHGHGGFNPPPSSPPAPAGVRSSVQRKPVASMSQSTLSAGPPIPQHSVVVASGRQERYTVSPASSIHRDRESQTTEHQEILSPISQGAGTSPERVPAAPNYQLQWHESETQQELADARARETLFGYGPTVMSYGPAPPVGDRGIAPTRFTLPALYPQPQSDQGFETIPIPLPRPTTIIPTTRSQEARPYGSSNDARGVEKETEGGYIHVPEGEKPQQTKATTTKERATSPFMHYEDIDYFGPEPESEPESPDLDLEQEKLKFAEAQFSLGEERISPRGKERIPTTTTAEISSSVTPAAAGLQMTEGNSVTYSPPLISEAADTLQMGVKARRSWERQQRRQAKRHQHHPEPTQMATIGTANPITMIMRIPSMISTGGRGGGSSVGGGGSHRGDNHSRNGDTGGGPGDDYRDQNPLHHSVSNPHSNRNGNHISPPPPNPKDPDNNNNHNPSTQGILTPWVSEILWCLVSIASLIAIILTLQALDGKGIEPTDWPISPNVTLNTLLAFLTAICQLALLIPITQGLAQLKWNWFARAAPGGIPRRERPLEDFALFNDAAFGMGRGGGWPWAALKLLFSGKGRTLGVGAAIVLLTSFLSSPLTQGAVGYRVGVIPAVGNDSIAVVSRSGGSGTPPFSQQKRAIQQAIYYDSYQSNDSLSILPPIQPQCTTPSCQFPLFTSLAICIDTADVSSKLSISNLTQLPFTTATEILGFRPDHVSNMRTARLPNGVFLVGGPDTANLNMSSPGDNSKPLAFTTQSATLANLFVIYTTHDQVPTFKAAEVIFHFCVNTYNVSTTQGISTTTVINSSTTVTNGTDKVLRLRDPLSNTNQTITVNLTTATSLQRQLVSLLKGTYSSAYGEEMNGLTGASEVLGMAMYGDGGGSTSQTITTTTTTTMTLAEPSAVPAVESRASPGSTNAEDGDIHLQKTIGRLMGNVAESLTNVIRASSQTTQIPGTPLTPTTTIHIQYPYLAFLSLQVLLSIAFLIGTIIQTAVWKVPVLKGSSIDTLLAISSRDRALLEEEERDVHQEEERGGGAGKSVNIPRVKLRLGSIGSGGGWFLDSSNGGGTGGNVG